MAGPSGRVGRPKKSQGWTKKTLAIDDAIFSATKELAQRQRCSIRSLIEKGLMMQLVDDAAQRTDADLAPLIDRVLQDRHKRLEAGLRAMMARVGYEVLRTQYIWLNFLTEAGISPGKVETWREQGWQYAVKEFKRQPKPEVDDE